MNFLQWVKISAVLSALIMSPLALADDAVPASPDGNGAMRLAKARELMTLLRAEEIYNNMSLAITQQIWNDVELRNRTRNQTQKDAINKIVDEEVSEAFEKLRPEFVSNFAKIYAAQFSAKELTELIAFYGSDTGRKTLDRLPGTVQQGLALGQYFADIALRMVSNRLADRLPGEVGNGQSS